MYNQLKLFIFVSVDFLALINRWMYCTGILVYKLGEFVAQKNSSI